MTAGCVFLLEIRTEEIPARMIDAALADLAAGLRRELETARLLEDAGPVGGEAIRTYGTPRRLAVEARRIRERQPDAEEQVTGPSVKVAYDAAGRPTRAAEGFARAQGVTPAELTTVATPKGECISVRRTIRGLPAREVLAQRVPALLASLGFPKMMRWGGGEHRFVRPVHGLVALLDGEVVRLTFAGVRAGRETRGHRLAGDAPVTLADSRDYLEALRGRLVMADPAERRHAITGALDAGARACGGSLAAPAGAAPGVGGDPELVAEVTHLVEWPLVVAGRIDEAFLDLPDAILVTSMRHHQKFFALRGPAGKLLNRFLAVANCREDRTGAIARGYEWVLRARLVDARFFHEEDRKRPLREHAAGLERVTFHEKLGSYAHKAGRMTRLVETILPSLGAAPVDAAAVAEAVRLCKADLTTQVVKEFPELEGIMGGLYAAADGCGAPVARAIGEHYLPRAADDPVPATREGAVVSLADRLDTQAGIFLLGMVPTGSRDPYGLRRSVLGTCRILIECGIHLRLPPALDAALAGFSPEAIGGAVSVPEAREALLEFYRGRMEHLGEAAGLRHDSVRAALAAGLDDPADAWLRMRALDALRADPGFGALARAHKRINNILRDQPIATAGRGGLREPAERGLERALVDRRATLEGLLQERDYAGALRMIGGLGGDLDRFFDEVMVLAADAGLRAARLSLLKSIADLFLRVGDFSEIVLEGEPAAPAGRRGRPAASGTGKER